MVSDEQIEAVLAQAQQTISRCGWMVQGVFPTKEGELGFAYTVGLTPAGVSELVISGPWNRQAQILLNTAAKRHLAVELQHGDTVEDEELAAVPLRIIEAPLAEVNTARRLYGEYRVRAVQLVWPDKNGLWPGSPLAPVKGQELFGVPWW